jgi:hypothetical protein
MDNRLILEDVLIDDFDFQPMLYIGFYKFFYGFNYPSSLTWRLCIVV